MPIEQKLQSQVPQEEMDEENDGPEEEGTEQEELDLKIAVLMGERLLENGGFDVIEKAVAQSKDPSQVIGQFLMQMGTQLFESMPDDVALSPSILLARGGWVEQMSDFIQEELGVKQDVMDRAEIYVATTAQQMAQQQAAPAGAPPQEAAPQPAGPAMPQGAM